MSWGAIFAGLVIAMALQITLTVLGAAIGLTALEGNDSGKAFGIGAGIWALIVPLITLFVGGLTAGRLAAVRDGRESFMHGALVWGLSLLIAAWLIGSGASRLIGGTLNLAGNLGSSVVGAAGEVASRPGLSASDLRDAAARARSEAAERGITEEAVRQRAAQVQERGGEVVEKAQGVAAGSAWIALLALALSLGAAVLGARRGMSARRTT